MPQVIAVMGVDPGLAATGYGVLEGQGSTPRVRSYGCIRTKPTEDLGTRLSRIHAELSRQMELSCAGCVVVEDVFSVPQNPQAGISLGQVVGVVHLAAHQLGIRVVSISSREVKMALTSSGAAGKGQVERAVRHWLNLDSPVRPVHSADALSIALAGFFRLRDLSATAQAGRESRPALG